MMEAPPAHYWVDCVLLEMERHLRHLYFCSSCRVVVRELGGGGGLFMV